MTSQTINLDLIPQGVAPIIHVSQYDKGQTWLFNAFTGDMAFSVPVGSSVTIQGTKPDGTGFQYACSFSGSTITAIEQEQMTVIAGKYPCEIAITSGGDLIASLNFYIMVEPAALSDDTVISETELPLIQQAIEAAQTVPALVEDAEAWAVGERGGVPVTSGDETYENNSKYYAEHCIGFITDAQWAQIEALLS